MNLESQIPIYNNASSDNSNSNNEKIHWTTTKSMIHNFLDVQKIMDYENTISSIAASQNFHPLGIFKDKHLKEQKFSILFYKQPWQIFEGFPCQQITQWELHHKFGDFSTNISNLFF